MAPTSRPPGSSTAGTGESGSRVGPTTVHRALNDLEREGCADAVRQGVGLAPPAPPGSGAPPLPRAAVGEATRTSGRRSPVYLKRTCHSSCAPEDAVARLPAARPGGGCARTSVPPCPRLAPAHGLTTRGAGADRRPRTAARSTSTPRSRRPLGALTESTSASCRSTVRTRTTPRPPAFACTSSTPASASATTTSAAGRASAPTRSATARTATTATATAPMSPEPPPARPTVSPRPRRSSACASSTATGPAPYPASSPAWTGSPPTPSSPPWPT